jgi:hypothetical protein
MDGFAVSVAVAVVMFVSGLIGLNLHRVLPERHLSKETHDVIRLGTGMLSVLASLVLGLMITTAKTSFDGTNAAVSAYAADLTVLDEILRDYGDGALTARRQVRDYTSRLLNDVWIEQYGHAYMVENRAAGDILEHAYEAIRALTPGNHDQQMLADGAVQLATSLLRERWLLIARSDTSMRPMIIVIVVFWLAAIFVSFGINAPRHATTHMVFLILAVGIGSAMFMILELNSPFQGPMRISSQPIQTALSHMLPEQQ